MTSSTHNFLPITKTLEPSEPAAVADEVCAAFESATPVYPIGGGTSLGFGLPAKQPGLGLSLAKLTRVIDYPARDMTITVDAGITMSALAATLATERQQFPVDVPHADRATLGGVIATNSNGWRRYGLGSVRDYVIGIHAVDGRGTPFKGGGRVVKNVAGYDFCKLLTGSLGTLAVITQVTLKLKPIAERSSFLICSPKNLDEAEQLLAALSRSETTPVAIELLSDAAKSSNLQLIVGLAGTDAEVTWMLQQLASEWRTLGITNSRSVEQHEAVTLAQQLAEFAAAGDSPLVIQAAIVPSGVTQFIAAVQQIDSQCAIQSHAGNGIVIAKFSQFPAAGLSRTVVGKLQGMARSLNGNVVILSNPSGAEQTHQSVWGTGSHFDLMTSVKKQFDPKNILNPGRFVYV